MKGHSPEATLQSAIKSEVDKMLNERRAMGMLATFFILEYFGLDLAVSMKWADGRYSFKLLELKAFVGTLLYIQVEQAIFGLSNDDEYNVTATNNKEEIKNSYPSDSNTSAKKTTYYSSENANKKENTQKLRG